MLREICNDIVAQLYSFVEPGSLWTNELDDTTKKLKTAIITCSSFKQLFFEYRAKVNDKSPDRPWKFEKTNVFARLDLFVDRLNDLLDIVLNIQDFLQLDKIDIGGIKVCCLLKFL